MLPYIISQDIVKYFHEIQNLSIEEIADITSASPSDVKKILKGSHTFNSNNIASIIEKTDKQIISILSKACPESHLTDSLRKNVILYKHIQEVKRKNQK
jgi:hypothetical protein